MKNNIIWVNDKKMKYCSKCKEYRDIAEFYPHITNKYSSLCKFHNKEYAANAWKIKKNEMYLRNKRWVANNKEKRKIYGRIQRLKRAYGLTLEAYEILVKNQNKRCLICNEIPKKKLVVDHDHKTGKIRGLLCEACNKGIGHFKDNCLNLQNAINYLRKIRT